MITHAEWKKTLKRFTSHGRKKAEPHTRALGDGLFLTTLLAQSSATEDDARNFPALANPYHLAAIRARAENAALPPLRWYPSDDPEAEPIDQPDHPLIRAVRCPNPLMTQKMLIEHTVAGKCHDGDTFWFLMDKDGKPWDSPNLSRLSQIVPIRGGLVEEKVGSGSMPETYSYTGAEDFPLTSVLRVTSLNPYSLTRGLGETQTLSKTTALMAKAENYVESGLDNGGNFGGVITTSQELSGAQRKRAEEKLNQEAKEARRRKEYLLIGQDAKVSFSPNSPEDMAYGDLMSYGRETVGVGYGVPLPVLGILDDATYSNYEQALRALWIVTIIPRDIWAIEDAINNMLIPRLSGAESKWKARFDLSSVDVLREDDLDKVREAREMHKERIAPFNASASYLGIDREPLQSPEADELPEEREPQPIQANSNTPADETERGRTASAPRATSKESEPASFERSYPRSKAQRAAYIAEHIRAMEEQERTVLGAFNAWQERYRKAQKTRLHSIAERGFKDSERYARWWTTKGKIETRVDSPSDLEALLLDEEEWADKVVEAMRAPLEAAVANAAINLANGLGTVFVGSTDLRILAEFDKQEIILRKIPETLREEIRNALFTVLQKNSTVNDLAISVEELLPELDAELQRVFGSRRARAVAIARTETNRAANAARVVQMTADGILEHEWLDSNDGDVRDSHEQLDGTVVRVGDPFAPGLTRPGDPDAPPSQTVNCRCTTAPVIRGTGSTLNTPPQPADSSEVVAS